MEKNNAYVLALIYVLLIVFTYLTFKFLIRNIILISIILPLFVLVVIYVVMFLPSRTNYPLNKKSVRYTMHCKRCNWEWMSNVGDKVPTVCPNCREKDRLEIIGWRQVLSSGKKQNIDLRKYLIEGQR